MQYAELRILPGRTGFHPADRALVEADAVERVAIHHFNRLDDGTVALLYQLRGDPDLARSVLDAHPDVLAASIAQTGTELHAYVHFDPAAAVSDIFQLPQEYSLVVDTPVECLPDGSIRVAVIGPRQLLTDALDLVPEAVTVELESMQAYEPDARRLYSTLTDRQREILRTAVSVGYYDVPRRATYEDVAAELDLAPVTVGEHLRKVESRVLTEIVPGLDR
jgi:DNA-binding CsgD family transcriptional regulator